MYIVLELTNALFPSHRLIMRSGDTRRRRRRRRHRRVQNWHSGHSDNPETRPYLCFLEKYRHLGQGADGICRESRNSHRMAPRVGWIRCCSALLEEPRVDDGSDAAIGLDLLLFIQAK